MSERTPDAATPTDPAELLARLEAERRRAAVLDEVIAAICHDLRGPLNNMLGWSSILKRSAPPEMMRGLDVIERSVRLQAWMFAEVIDLYRIAGGCVARDVTDVDLGALAREVGATVQTGIGCTVQVVAPEAPLLVRADKTLVGHMLRAVLTYLGRSQEASIRVDYGAREGVAWLTLTEARRGHFPLDRFEEYLRGTAVPERLFTNGAGLALLVTSNVTRAHGGSVRQVPDGIEVTFPLATRTAARVSEPSRLSSLPPAEARVDRSLEGFTVLVVDDDPQAREVLEVILSGHGARVQLAESAAAALRSFRADRPDVIVSDIGMPEQDGYDLIRQIRAHRADLGGTVPAIALSALTRPEDRNRSMRAGFQMHVSKPITASEVVEAVKKLLPQRAAAR